MPATSTVCGLVVMAYGTPASPDDVESYYTHIRRGRPPNADQLADLQRRYAAIGGVSPLMRHTQAQVSAIEAGLFNGPDEWVVAQGNKHAAPFIEDAIDELAKQGAATVVGLVLAPHYSQASVGTYHSRAIAAAEERELGYRAIDSWQDEPAWIYAMAQRVQASLKSLPKATSVLFSAHSLPERVLQDDPYADNLLVSAKAIAARAGLGDSQWSLAWQSAGATPEPWRGPDVMDVMREVAASGDAPAVLVCPQGFVADHLEVLYDLDIEAAELADELGLGFARTASLNDEPAVMAALADRVRQAGR